jgi:TetR/AcrR family transcriptional regulator, regulator of autoinduction and epiphytic fitness
VKSVRRIGTEHSATRTALLDATEHLMRVEGYAAVSTRRVAKQVGLTAGLVHYYFPVTDDLLVAVYRRAVERTLERFTQAISSDNPVRALWTLNTDPACTALAMEFMALANHRKVIRTEIVRSAESYRKMQAAALSNLYQEKGLNACPPFGLAVLMAGISSVLVMEEALGISSGHAEARDFIETWLRRLEQGRKPGARPQRPSRRR